MKNMVARVLTALIFLGVLALGPAIHAQRTEQIIKANIPFEFTVASRIFPAGEYTLVRSEPSQLELRDSGGRVLVNVLTQSVERLSPSVQAKLRFESEEGRHVLTEVWQERTAWPLT